MTSNDSAGQQNSTDIVGEGEELDIRRPVGQPVGTAVAQESPAPVSIDRGGARPALGDVEYRSQTSGTDLGDSGVHQSSTDPESGSLRSDEKHRETAQRFDRPAGSARPERPVRVGAYPGDRHVAHDPIVDLRYEGNQLGVADDELLRRERQWPAQGVLGDRLLGAQLLDQLRQVRLEARTDDHGHHRRLTK